MPNLLPDWTQTLPWDLGVIHLRAAGRLVWAILLLVVGVAFVVAIIVPPKWKRPFPLWVEIALFPAIVVATLLAAKFVPSVQRSIVWLGIAALVLHGLAMVVGRNPRDPERTATWSECFAGAVGVFAIFALGYAIIPSEWLTFANGQLEWGDNAKFIFTSHQPILGIAGLPSYPFAVDYPALRDIVVTMIYAVFLGVNLKLWIMWQHRFEPKAAPVETEAPPKRSRFGRPLRAKAST